MNIGGKDVPTLLVKVFSKKEYVDDFLAGKLYLNESGYFHKLDDTFRGDKYDGVIAERNAIIYIGNECFHPDEFIQGFVGDDKVPIFSTTILDEYALEQLGNDHFRIKVRVIEELSQFGDYAVIFRYDEFKYKLGSIAEKENINIFDNFVKYVNMNDSTKQYLEHYKGSIYNKFFIKDISYKNQNEYRFIFCSRNMTKFTPLIDEKSHHLLLNFGPLEIFYCFETKKNINITLTDK